MYGAILGDMVGAPYEFDQGNKSKDFEFWNEECRYTDDTVMTIAVAEALMKVGAEGTESEIKQAVVHAMQDWGHRYPNAGYGGRFREWLRESEPKPYNSWGNGSAMRVSSVGWLYDSMERVREVARWTAEVTHNHPEGIKGAEATAAAIFLARTGASKEEIRDYIINEFHYDLSRTCDEIRPGYHHVESCQETVPEAITAFLEGEDFEDVIRTAVSLGGDCDTLTCIAGGIAETFYGIYVENYDDNEFKRRLEPDMLSVVEAFDEQTFLKNRFALTMKPAELYEDGLAETDEDRKRANALFTLPEGKELYHTKDGYGNYSLKRTGDDSYVLDVCSLDYAQIGLRIEKTTVKKPVPNSFGAATMREYYENLENEKLAASGNETFDVDEYYLYIGENKFFLCSSFSYRYVPVELLICKSGHMYDPTGPGDIEFTMEILCGVSNLDESTGEASIRRNSDQKVIFNFDVMLYEHKYQFTHLDKVYEG